MRTWTPSNQRVEPSLPSMACDFTLVTHLYSVPNESCIIQPRGWMYTGRAGEVEGLEVAESTAGASEDGTPHLTLVSRE